MSTIRTFRYEEVDIDHISAIELCEGFEHAKHAQLFHIIVYPHGVDEPPISERADALYLPEVGRLGIAWNSDATWADVDNVESGIEMWINERETWEQWN